MLSTWKKDNWNDMCPTSKSKCQNSHTDGSEPGSSPPNAGCGGFVHWGCPKEGPNGMGRRSPGNMWVRERA